jgi:hypothetical protein
MRTQLSELSITDRKRVETKYIDADAAYQFRQETDVIALWMIGDDISDIILAKAQTVPIKAIFSPLYVI